MFPYLAANAATPLAAVMLGRLPDAARAEPTLFLLGRGITDGALLQALGYLCFIAILVPLVVGGKVYNSLKAVMTFKIVASWDSCVFLAIFYSKANDLEGDRERLLQDRHRAGALGRRPQRKRGARPRRGLGP